MLYAMRTGKLTAGLGLLRRLDILIRYKVVKYDCHPVLVKYVVKSRLVELIDGNGSCDIVAENAVKIYQN